jgi:hypothetical protein
MTIDLPGPERRIASHEYRETEHMPSDIMKSRYNGNRKLDASVSKDGTMPGYCSENPVASVAKFAKAAMDIIP